MCVSAPLPPPTPSPKPEPPGCAKRPSAAALSSSSVDSWRPNDGSCSTGSCPGCGVLRLCASLSRGPGSGASAASCACAAPPRPLSPASSISVMLHSAGAVAEVFAIDSMSVLASASRTSPKSSSVVSSATPGRDACAHTTTGTGGPCSTSTRSTCSCGPDAPGVARNVTSTSSLDSGGTSPCDGRTVTGAGSAPPPPVAPATPPRGCCWKLTVKCAGARVGLCSDTTPEAALPVVSTPGSSSARGATSSGSGTPTPSSPSSSSVIV
mmetsp:Transcript_8081/g.24367  ORF Transcript_8081/g.24367 Transcript_8081/m.24367 type:complete len:267 (-) Transcript_8081:2268-3068(-)